MNVECVYGIYTNYTLPKRHLPSVSFKDLHGLLYLGVLLALPEYDV